MFVKKSGNKVETYIEGRQIDIETDRAGITADYISKLKNDSITVNGLRFHRKEIKQIILHDKKHFVIEADAKLPGLITAGVGISTFGMTLNNRETFTRALRNSDVIGYGPLLISAIRKKISLKRRSYRTSKKFRIDILNFYF